jgi:hypothetical protein
VIGALEVLATYAVMVYVIVVMYIGYYWVLGSFIEKDEFTGTLVDRVLITILWPLHLPRWYRYVRAMIQEGRQ